MVALHQLRPWWTDARNQADQIHRCCPFAASFELLHFCGGSALQWQSWRSQRSCTWCTYARAHCRSLILGTCMCGYIAWWFASCLRSLQLHNFYQQPNSDFIAANTNLHMNKNAWTTSFIVCSSCFALTAVQHAVCFSQPWPQMSSQAFSTFPALHIEGGLIHRMRNALVSLPRTFWTSFRRKVHLLLYITEVSWGLEVQASKATWPLVSSSTLLDLHRNTSRTRSSCIMQNEVLVPSNKPDHQPLFDHAMSSVGIQAVAGNSLSLSFTQQEKH